VVNSQPFKNIFILRQSLRKTIVSQIAYAPSINPYPKKMNLTIKHFLPALLIMENPAGFSYKMGLFWQIFQ